MKHSKGSCWEEKSKYPVCGGERLKSAGGLAYVGAGVC